MKLEELPLIPGWDTYDWKETLGSTTVVDTSHTTRLPLSADTVTVNQIQRVESMYSSDDDRTGYADTDLAALIELTDGRWATLHAGNDTSGWGCMGDYVEWRIFDTRGEAIIMGLTNESRGWLGIELP